MFQVLFGASVVLENEHALLNRAQQREMLRVLEDSPRAQKPLTGVLQGYYRYRCSDIRVVFTVDDPTSTVTIIAIGRRRDSEIYNLATKRA